MPGFEYIGKEELQAVTNVFTKNNGYLYRYGKGHFVKDFEEAFAKHFKVKYVHAVSSGSAALKLSLQALGVKPGDEVITQCHTFVATVEAIVECGATPVVVDINKSLNMDPMELKKAITSKTKVVIPVHMSGVPCAMKYINEVIEGTNIKILEDNAQSPGATYKDQYTGTIGDAGILSFDYGKMITTGEGGAILTNDEKLYKQVSGLSDHGHASNSNLPRGMDDFIGTGFNFKMTELQGALGLAQLHKLNKIISCHRENKDALIKGIENDVDLRYQPDPKGDIGSCVSFFFEYQSIAKKFVQEWNKLGYTTFNLPDAMKYHNACYWNHIKFDSTGLMYSNNLLNRTISIPIMGKYSKNDIKERIDIIKKIVGEIQ